MAKLQLSICMFQRYEKRQYPGQALNTKKESNLAGVLWKRVLNLISRPPAWIPGTPGNLIRSARPGSPAAAASMKNLITP